MSAPSPALLRRGVLAFTFAAVSVAGTQTAFAIDDSSKSVARQLSAEGKTEYDAGNYPAAADKLKRAYSTTRVPTIGLWYARSLLKLSRWVEASELLREVAKLPPNELWLGDVQQNAQGEAQQELNALLPRIPSLTFVVKGADPAQVTLNVDGTPIPSALHDLARPTDPGTHQVTATLGETKLERSVTLKEGEQGKVVLPFEPSANVTATDKTNSESASTAGSTTPTTSNAHGSTQRTLGWVTLGVGAAGLATGAIAGILVKSRYGGVDDACNEQGKCNDTVKQSEIDSYNLLRTLSMAGFIGGGVLAAAGVTLVLTSPQSSGPQLEATVTGNYVGLSGRF